MAGYIGSKASVVSSGAEHKKVFDITTTTTSLTGLVYTPTLVHVFHNGVRLVDGTDYTATSGTTITLTVAAENGDQVVVISYATFQTSDTVSASAGGTFAGDVSVTGAFTSLGIDDNATSTAITIDSSQNVGIGTASPSGELDVTASKASGVTNLYVRNPDNTGGAAIRVQSQTDAHQAILGITDAGSGGRVGTLTNDDFYFVTNNTERLRIDLSGHLIAPYGITLGTAVGTYAAANTLDDYEEGTWTATVSSGTVSGTSSYTRIGRMVYVTADLILAGTRGAEGFRVGGLPFAVPRWSPGGFYCNSYSQEGTDQISAAASGGSSDVGFVAFGDEAAGNEFGNGYFVFSIWYNL